MPTKRRDSCFAAFVAKVGTRPAVSGEEEARMAASWASPSRKAGEACTGSFDKRRVKSEKDPERAAAAAAMATAACAADANAHRHRLAAENACLARQASKLAMAGAGADDVVSFNRTRSSKASENPAVLAKAALIA